MLFQTSAIFRGKFYFFAQQYTVILSAEYHRQVFSRLPLLRFRKIIDLTLDTDIGDCDQESVFFFNLFRDILECYLKIAHDWVFQHSGRYNRNGHPVI